MDEHELQEEVDRGRTRGLVLALPIALVLLQMPGAPLDHDSRQDRLGALEGVVRLSGYVQVHSTRVVNTTDPDVCGPQHSLEDFVVSEDRGIQYVTVALLDVPAEARGAIRSRTRLEVDNRNCRFVPHVAVVAVGDTIVAKNSDPVLHTTHYYGPLHSNVALPRPDMSVSRVVRKPGIIAVLCDVHGWMKAFIRVDDHDFHDVTDETGSFAVRDIPPGSYTAEFWHEKLGTQRIEIEIVSGETTRVEVVYSLADSDIEH